MDKNKDGKYAPLLLVSWLSLTLAATGLSQTEVEPGFNLFSPEQDVEIGRRSAKQVEQQFPLLDAPGVEDWVSRVGQRLVRATPGPDYPYQFDVVNAREINAFALPGGFMYLNRGLIEAAGSEAELAGVMAHEISHVALRHGTNQASKAYLAQAGLGILGGLLGDRSTSQIVGAVGGFGLNALFLKFSRSAEQKADILGAQILADAGYDPMAMVAFFERLREQGGEQSGIEEFFSSHPSPEDRAERVREETRLIGDIDEHAPVGGFARVQRRLDRLPAAPDRQARGERGQGQPGRIEAPSDRFQEYRDRSGLFEIRYPENWSVHPNRSGPGVTIVPRGGVVRTENRRNEILYGVIVNHYEPFDDRFRSRFRHEDSFGQNVSLREATEDLIHQLLRSNNYLEVSGRSWRRERFDGAPGLSVELNGISPVTGERERVILFTRLLEDGHVLYTLFIAPDQDYRRLGNTFERMLASLDVRAERHHSR